MEEDVILILFGILIGLFCITASIFNWDWFFHNIKARIVVKILGRKFARIFYFLLGLLFLLSGISLFF